MSKRRKNPSEGNPRTGDRFGAKGKMPTEIGILQMRSGSRGASQVDGYGLRRKQPKGWGIARVVNIFTKKERGK